MAVYGKVNTIAKRSNIHEEIKNWKQLAWWGIQMPLHQKEKIKNLYQQRQKEAQHIFVGRRKIIFVEEKIKRVSIEKQQKKKKWTKV